MRTVDAIPFLRISTIFPTSGRGAVNVMIFPGMSRVGDCLCRRCDGWLRRWDIKPIPEVERLRSGRFRGQSCEWMGGMGRKEKRVPVHPSSLLSVRTRGGRGGRRKGRGRGGIVAVGVWWVMIE